MKRLHCAECGLLAVGVRKYKIMIKTEGRELFADRSIGNKEVLGYYYVSLVSQHLKKYRIKSKFYGEGMMSATVADFGKWATKVK